MSTAAWELVFMLVVLKLPILYLIGVVWYAVRAQPPPPDVVRVAAQPTPCPWDGRRRGAASRRLPRAHRPRTPSRGAAS